MIESANPISTSFQRGQKFLEQHRLTSQNAEVIFRTMTLILPLRDGFGRKSLGLM